MEYYDVRTEPNSSFEMKYENICDLYLQSTKQNGRNTALSFARQGVPFICWNMIYHISMIFAGILYAHTILNNTYEVA